MDEIKNWDELPCDIVGDQKDVFRDELIWYPAKRGDFADTINDILYATKTRPEYLYIKLGWFSMETTCNNQHGHRVPTPGITTNIEHSIFTKLHPAYLAAKGFLKLGRFIRHVKDQSEEQLTRIEKPECHNDYEVYECLHIQKHFTLSTQLTSLHPGRGAEFGHVFWLNNDGLLAISEAIASSTTVTDVKIKLGPLCEDSGCFALAQALRSNKSLHQAVIQCASLSPVSLEALRRASGGSLNRLKLIYCQMAGVTGYWRQCDLFFFKEGTADPQPYIDDIANQ